MKNSKKILSMAVAAALSGVLLVTTALAASNNVSGYEKLKEALFNSAQMKNYTTQMDYSLLLDDVEVMSGVSFLQKDNFNTSTKTETTSNGETGSYASSFINGTSTSTSSGNDTYTQFTSPSWAEYEKNQTEFTDNQKKLVNIVFDLFAGNTKNFFTNNDGQITATLEKRQIPEFFQAATTVMAEQIGKLDSENHGSGMFTDDNKVDDALLNMAIDMTIESVSIDTFIDDNDSLEKATMSFVVSGKDASGNIHYLTFNSTIVVKDVGTTVVEEIDISGKTLNLETNEIWEDSKVSIEKEVY